MTNKAKKQKSNTQRQGFSTKEKFQEVGKGKAGFTLIELIVVMAIIAILVLLAIPKLMGRTAKAEEARLTYDAKVLDAGLDVYSIQHPDFLKDEWKVEGSGVLLIAEENRLYNRQGVVIPDNLPANDYYLIPDSFLDESLEVKRKDDSNVYYHLDGNLYLESGKSYASNGSPVNTPTEPEPEPIISNIPTVINGSVYSHLTNINIIDDISTVQVSGLYYHAIKGDISILEYTKAVYLNSVLMGYLTQKITMGSYTFGYKSKSSATFITVDNQVYNIPLSLTNYDIATVNSIDNGDGTYILKMYDGSLTLRISIPVDTNKSIVLSP